MSRHHFSDWSSAQQGAVLAVASVELSLLATAVMDVQRQSAPERRRRSTAWLLALLVVPVGSALVLAHEASVS